MTVEWLLDCEPREVQLEALRRSYYGFALKDHKDDEGTQRQLHRGQRRGWGHFLEMRLGKTPTAINEWLLFEQEHNVSQLVVFTPNSYKYSWVNEFEHFGVPYPAVPLDLGPKVGQTLEDLRRCNTPVALVVNYEAMQHKHGREAVAEFVSRRPTGMVFDESIKLKNPQSIQTKACTEVAKDAVYTRPLTGRPITQGPHDLYPQLRLSGLLEGKNFYAFRNKYCKMGGFKNKKVVGVRNEEDLKSLMKRGVFVAKRMDWADMINPTFVIDSLSQNEEQAKHYATMEKDFYAMVGEEIVDVDQVITQWMKLQQISSGFVYDENKKAHWLCDPKKLPKVERLLGLLEETDSKVVVCFHYKPSGELLREVLKQYDPAFIYGKQWMAQEGRDYDSEKKRFNNDPKCRVVIGQLDATKYGHDLTGTPGDRTTIMVFYENTISLDTRGQVEARITASKQDWDNLYIDFVSSKIEQDFVKALINKQTLEQMVMGTYGVERWAEK